MTGATISRVAGGSLQVSGALVFATVSGLLEQGRGLLNGKGEITVDLAGVTRADSAGLALMLEWVDECRAAGRAIRFCHVPESLLEIARVNNVSELLPLAENRNGI